MLVGGQHGDPDMDAMTGGDLALSVLAVLGLLAATGLWAMLWTGGDAMIVKALERWRRWHP